MSGFENEVLYSVGQRLEPSSAQAIGIMQKTAADVSIINHVGNPNGVVSANPSSLSHDPVSGQVYRKVSGTGTTIWSAINSGGIQTITGNAGGAIPPDGAGNINILLSHTNILLSGAGNTLTADFLDPTFGNLLLGSAVAQTLGPGAQALTSVGATALNSATTAVSDCAVGDGALQSATTASFCNMVGSSAGQSIVDAAYNNGVGYQCLHDNVSGNSNNGFGYRTLTHCTGNDNSAFGMQAMPDLITGQFNVAIGSGAGNAYTGAESSNIVIANTGVVGESHALRIGIDGSTLGKQNACFIAGIQGSTVVASAPVGVDANSQLSSLGFGALGQVLTSTGAGSSPTWQSGASLLSITSVNNAASPYTVLTADRYIACLTSTGAITIRLPNAPTTGRVITIKDRSGAAAASNISVTTVGGAVTIDGVTTYTMSINYQAINLIFNGVSYEVF